MPRREVSTFWTRLKQGAEDHGFKKVTQTEVARFLGIKQPSVAEWNRPEGFPSLPAGAKLAKRYHLNIHWLYTGQGPKSVPPPDQETEDMLATWIKLGSKARSRVLAYAHARLDDSEGEPDGHAAPFLGKPA